MSEALRVGLDLSCLEVQPETGVERYARRLVEHLPAAAPDLPFAVFIRRGHPAPAVQPPCELHPLRSLLPRAAWRELAMPRALAQTGVELLHAPVAAVPFQAKVRRVATIHDVPDPDRVRLFERHRIRLLHAVRVCAGLVVPSHATEADLLELAPRARGRVHVIPHGVDPDFRPEGLPLDRARYGIEEGPYLLWVGTLRERKDPHVLIEAFGRLLDEGRDLQLVLCGHQQVDVEKLLEPIAARGARERVIAPGYAAREDLPELYREAELVCVPSRLEGFGMCALEAMATGTPLVISRDRALQEIAGDAALVNESGTGRGLAEVLARVLDEEDARARAVGEALERSSAYSWAASAEAHARLYRALLRA